MDKLIKNRFWILLALVLPLVVYGYYSANNAIKAATTQRVSALDKAYGAIPNGDGPNDTYVKAEYGGLDVYNEQLRKAVDTEMVRVWEDQKPRMKWPTDMVEHGFIPDAYRGEFTSDAAYIYKAGYEQQRRKLYDSIEPIRLERGGGVSGKVQFQYVSLPGYQFGPLSVPSETIWDAQEDLWLLQLLFDAIRNTNRSAENAAKSAVRSLYVVQLMGGDGQSTAVAGGGGGGGAGFNAHREDGDEDFGRMGGPMMGAAGGMGAFGSMGVAFSPTEEFGIGVESAGGGAAGASGAGFNAHREDGDEDFGPMAGGPMGMSGAKPIRYISFNESARFQERGFYMSVLIDQKKIADFLVELSNADWPIRIVRFNVGPNTGSGGGGGGLLGGSMFAGSGGHRNDDDDDGGMFGSANFARALGGGPGMGMPTSPLGGPDDFQFEAPGYGDMHAGTAGLGTPGGGIGPAPLVSGDQIRDLFTHPDLVQMDLCGVITMYRPPTPELLAAVIQAAGGDATAPAADASASSAEGAEPPAGETSDPAATGGEAGSVPATTDEAAAGEPLPTDAAAGGETGAAAPEDAAAPAADAEPAPTGAATDGG